MMSCIFVFYLLAFPLTATLVPSVSPAPAMIGRIQDELPDPDALYARRENVTYAQQAAAIWQSRLQKNLNDFDSAWKLARATYWIGTQGPAAERRSALEQGIAA